MVKTSSTVTAVITPGQQVSTVPRQEGFSETWRYVGQIKDKDNVWAVITDSQGRLRLESPGVFQGKGMTSVGTVDGQRVTSFSGIAAQSQFLPTQKENK